MSSNTLGSTRALRRTFILLAAVLGIGVALTVWKYSDIQAANAATANQPEPVEAVAVAVATEREHRATTTSIGTVLALRSVTLRNEVSGTVQQVMLTPGAIVEAGEVLVAFDVAVEQAELAAHEAEAALAGTALDRVQRLMQDGAAAQADLDRARAERDVALAQIARVKAIIARKTIRAPFRARVGLADVHPGQYLSEGTVLTTLQGVAEGVRVDFAVAQDVATQLAPGDTIFVTVNGNARATPARIVATDALVDPTTRNALVRAYLEHDIAVAPGASVRVRVPVGAPINAVVVPVSALRKGPAGDHVFVVEADEQGKPRARLRTVQAGEVLGDSVLIMDGLAAGERVAASGSFKLREGVLVAVANGVN